MNTQPASLSSDAIDSCPFCQGDDCEHLVTRMDTLGAYLGSGAFVDVEQDALTELAKAVLGEAKDSERAPPHQPRLPQSLEELLAAAGTMVDDVEFIGLYACRGPLRDYLNEVFCDLKECVRTEVSVDEIPGMSTTYVSFWSQDAMQAACSAGAVILEHARLLSAA